MRTQGSSSGAEWCSGERAGRFLLLLSSSLLCAHGLLLQCRRLGRSVVFGWAVLQRVRTVTGLQTVTLSGPITTEAAVHRTDMDMMLLSPGVVRQASPADGRRLPFLPLPRTASVALQDSAL